MFGNRTESGRNNIAGIAIYNRRKALGISQREVADRLRSHGLVIDKNAVQRMESGERFIIDTELIILGQIQMTVNTLKQINGSHSMLVEFCVLGGILYTKHRIYTQRVLSTALGKLFFCLFKRELSGRLPIIPVVVFGIKRPDVKAECRNIPFAGFRQDQSNAGCFFFGNA